MRTVIATCALIVTATIAGCGGGDSEPAVSPPVSVTTGATTAQTPGTVTTVAGDVGAGRTVFEQNCQACHPNGGSEPGAGPVLQRMGFSADQIRHQITNPRQAMPPNLVEGVDLDNVTAYVAGLQ